MSIEWNRVVQDPMHVALPRIQKSLNGYLASYDLLKIGVTANPEPRWERGYAPNEAWTKMVLLYESNDVDEAKEMERALIKYVRAAHFLTEIDNVGAGGEGLLPGRAPYWVYVVVGQPR